MGSVPGQYLHFHPGSSQMRMNTHLETISYMLKHHKESQIAAQADGGCQDILTKGFDVSVSSAHTSQPKFFGKTQNSEYTLYDSLIPSFACTSSETAKARYSRDKIRCRSGCIQGIAGGPREPLRSTGNIYIFPDNSFDLLFCP